MQRRHPEVLPVVEAMVIAQVEEQVVEVKRGGHRVQRGQREHGGLVSAEKHGGEGT
jgi:hypothetical protein